MGMELPLVSIIIPVYNSEATLRRCVDSVLNQDYRNTEVFLVDDGSQDGSLDICLEYAVKDPRVKVIHKTQSGVSDSRNMAMDQARGVYLQFVDSDDWISQDATSLMANAAEHTKCDLVVTHFFRVKKKRMRNGYQLVRRLSAESPVPLLCGNRDCRSGSHVLLREDEEQPGDEGSHREEYHSDETIYIFLLQGPV